jgi:hypothetical protein
VITYVYFKDYEKFCTNTRQKKTRKKGPNMNTLVKQEKNKRFMI